MDLPVSSLKSIKQAVCDKTNLPNRPELEVLFSVVSVLVVSLEGVVATFHYSPCHNRLMFLSTMLTFLSQLTIFNMMLRFQTMSFIHNYVTKK